MARSMTAFARHETQDRWGRAVWELRSVNHRHLEVGLRLPEELRAVEGEVRARLAQRLNRGKIDCGLRFDASAGEGYQLRINMDLARQLMQAAERIAGELGDAAPIAPLDVLRWPGVLHASELDLEEVSRHVLAALDTAIDELVAARGREGAKLKALVLARCRAMAGIVDGLKSRVPEIVAAISARHQQRIQELAAGLDQARVEQECALLAQRLDVAEELDRLVTHLAEVERVLERDEPVGRRLDFLMQELNREANTLGSKSAHIDTSGASVELKVLIEQMREQIQNIE